MYYLSIMTEEQTLVIFSGHPNGLFPSFPSSPRVVVTNGIMKVCIDLADVAHSDFLQNVVKAMVPSTTGHAVNDKFAIYLHPITCYMKI